MSQTLSTIVLLSSALLFTLIIAWLMCRLWRAAGAHRRASMWPLAGTGEGIQLPGAVDANGDPLPPCARKTQPSSEVMTDLGKAFYRAQRGGGE